jgi:large-conductance mechanosensitive channel
MAAELTAKDAEHAKTIESLTILLKEKDAELEDAVNKVKQNGMELQYLQSSRDLLSELIGFLYWGASLLAVAQFVFVLNDLFLVLQAKTKTGKKVQAALQRQQEEAVEAATHVIKAQRDAVR